MFSAFLKHSRFTSHFNCTSIFHTFHHVKSKGTFHPSYPFPQRKMAKFFRWDDGWSLRSLRVGYVFLGGNLGGILGDIFGRYIPLPIPSMYGIYTYIYHKNQPNVGKYTIHGWYGLGSHDFNRPNPVLEKLGPSHPAKDAICSKVQGEVIRVWHHGEQLFGWFNGQLDEQIVMIEILMFSYSAISEHEIKVWIVFFLSLLGKPQRFKG